MRKAQVTVHPDATMEMDTTVRTDSASQKPRKQRSHQQFQAALASESDMSPYEQECQPEKSLEEAFEKFDRSGAVLDDVLLKVPPADKVALKAQVLMSINDQQATFQTHSKADSL